MNLQCADNRIKPILDDKKTQKFSKAIIGVYSPEQLNKTNDILNHSEHKPPVNINMDWYYGA